MFFQHVFQSNNIDNEVENGNKASIHYWIMILNSDSDVA